MKPKPPQIPHLMLCQSLGPWYPHLGLCLPFEGMIQKTGVTLPKRVPVSHGTAPAPTLDVHPHFWRPQWPQDTFWYPQHLRFMFALASAELLLQYFQGDVLSQQLGTEMPLLRGEYHQKHHVLGRCSTGQVQSQASPAGKERREVKDKLKLERKLNMLFCRTLLALICQFFPPSPLPVVQCKHPLQLVRARGLWQTELLRKTITTQGLFLAALTTAGPLCTHHHILNLASVLLLPIHGSAACRAFLC